MVKVWYEPPPFGPRSSLDRPSYGLVERGTPRWVIQLSKAPGWQVMTGTIIVFSAVAWIPLSKSIWSTRPFVCFVHVPLLFFQGLFMSVSIQTTPRLTFPNPRRHLPLLLRSSPDLLLLLLLLLRTTTTVFAYRYSGPEAPVHHVPRVRGRPACLHAVPQHEPHLRTVLEVSIPQLSLHQTVVDSYSYKNSKG